MKAYKDGKLGGGMGGIQSVFSVLCILALLTWENSTRATYSFSEANGKVAKPWILFRGRATCDL